MDVSDGDEDNQAWTPSHKPKKVRRGVPKASLAKPRPVKDRGEKRKLDHKAGGPSMEVQKADIHPSHTDTNNNARSDGPDPTMGIGQASISYNSGFPYHASSQSVSLSHNQLGYPVQLDSFASTYGSGSGVQPPMTFTASTNWKPEGDMYSHGNLLDTSAQKYEEFNEHTKSIYDIPSVHQNNTNPWSTNQQRYSVADSIRQHREHSFQCLIGNEPMPSDQIPVSVQPKNEAAGNNQATEPGEKMFQNNNVSSTPGDEDDDSPYEDRPAKVRKLNKDGVPRKPRDPRPKLIKWDDNDWRNVVLGMVWSCGENGYNIQFDQVAQHVNDRCTASALQQALLKLRAKQNAEGYQIPMLRMSWSRNTTYTPVSGSKANTNVIQDPNHSSPLPRKKPTRMAGTQSLMVILRRPYIPADRQRLGFPYQFLKQSANLFTKMFHPKWRGDQSIPSNNSDANGPPVITDPVTAFPTPMSAFAVNPNSRPHFGMATVVHDNPAGSVHSMSAELEIIDSDEEEENAPKFTPKTGPFSGFTGRLTPETPSPLAHGDRSYHVRNKRGALDGSPQNRKLLLDAALLLPRPSRNAFAADPNMSAIKEDAVFSTPRRYHHSSMSSLSPIPAPIDPDIATPSTPTNSVAANTQVCNNLSSAFRYDGALNPQGNSNTYSVNGEYTMDRDDGNTVTQASQDELNAYPFDFGFGVGPDLFEDTN